MTLHFSDGSRDVFRINQKYATGSADADFRQSSGTHPIKYRREDKTLVITVELSNREIENELAEKLHEEGLAQCQQQHFVEARKKWEEAKDAVLKQRTTNDKAETYHQEGRFLLQQAWDLEKKNEAEEAAEKFGEARAKLELALAVKSSTGIQKNLELAISKITRNEQFNEALETEKKAHELFQKALKSGVLSHFAAAESRHQQALVQYEAACKTLEDGAKSDEKFRDRVDVAKGIVTEVKEVIESVEEIDLNVSFSKVELKDEERGNVEEELKGKNFEQVTVGG